MQNLLDVQNLTTRFKLVRYDITAVDGISFSLAKGEVMAIVGESGCGKSVTALSILNLVPSPGTVDKDSRVMFDGKNLLELSEKEIAQIRGNRIAMIFQEPSASFNLLFKIGYQIGEALMIHKKLAKNEALREAAELLKKVRIPEPASRVSDFPFQLSGGMLQRVMIALALSCRPELLIADEPTTALDVTIQAQIMQLLKELSIQEKMAILFITHDLALIDGFADTVMIMYAGRVVEKSPVQEVYARPFHPYAGDLLDSIPRLGFFKDEHTLSTIRGNVPELHDLPTGCKYAPRCGKCFDKCLIAEPPLFNVLNRLVRCWLFESRAAGDK